MAERKPQRFIILARIGAPHGVRGAARVKLFGHDPMSLMDYGPLQRARGGPDISITDLRAGKTPDMVVASFAGITSREAVEPLNGIELGLPRAALPDNDEDDFYHADLIGLEARLMDGSHFGEVIQVVDFGAGDLLDIAPKRGGASVLVPFSKAIVPLVRVEEGYLLIDAPEGLLDPPRSKSDKGVNKSTDKGADNGDV